MSNELYATIENDYKEAYAKWDELNRLFDNPDHDETFEDTLTRKYEEGFSDALAMVMRLMKEDN